jgi:hypothetical protein
MYSNQYEANFGILERRRTRRRRLFSLIVVLIISSALYYVYFAQRVHTVPAKIKPLPRFPADWSCKHTLQGHKYVTDDRGINFIFDTSDI